MGGVIVTENHQRSMVGRSGRLLAMPSPRRFLAVSSPAGLPPPRPGPSSRTAVSDRRHGRVSVVAATLGGVIENDVTAVVPGRRPGRRVGRRAVGRGEFTPGWAPSTLEPRWWVAPRGSAITKTRGSAITKAVHVAMGRGVLTSASRSTSLSRSSNICSRFARVGWSGPMPRVASPARRLVPVAPDCRGLRAGCAGAGEGIPPGPASGLDHGSAASLAPGSIEGSSFVRTVETRRVR